ncbi:hypothetical protein M444_00700 [Streptomyces sp. Mg1]|nr:hypothetical protein M444_00700 [Streptomyces sp. Mg1]
MWVAGAGRVRLVSVTTIRTWSEWRVMETPIRRVCVCWTAFATSSETISRASSTRASRPQVRRQRVTSRRARAGAVSRGV